MSPKQIKSNTFLNSRTGLISNKNLDEEKNSKQELDLDIKNEAEEDRVIHFKV